MIKFLFLICFFWIINLHQAQAGESLVLISGFEGSGDFNKPSITITQPDGKRLNCKAFNDKKHDIINYKDSWNGVYFSLSGESSSLHGNFKVNVSDFSFAVAPEYMEKFTAISDSINNPNSKSISSKYGVVSFGGGMLFNRLYFASDVDLRLNSFNFKKQVGFIKINEQGESRVASEGLIDIYYKNVLMLNAKIGYLLTNRFLTYVSAGIGYLSSYEIKSEQYDIEFDSGNNSASSPLRIGLGGEFMISNNFRFVADYSYWSIPKTYQNFQLIDRNDRFYRTENIFVGSLRNNSYRLGILYRF